MGLLSGVLLGVLHRALWWGCFYCAPFIGSFQGSRSFTWVIQVGSSRRFFKGSFWGVSGPSRWSFKKIL